MRRTQLVVLGLSLVIGPIVGLVVGFVSGTAHAATRGTLLRSYWNDSGTTIYSDVLLEHDDGSSEIVSEIGGSVDGIAMIQFEVRGTSAARLGFVPTRNDSSAALHWAESWVFITPDSAGTAELEGDSELTALQAGAQAWNDAVSGCSYMRIMVKAPEAHEVGYDGKNIVKYRVGRWCRPAVDGKPEKCYSAAATAITTVTLIDNASRADNGRILDADIEINTVDFAMATGCESRCVTLATSGTVEDLQNTLTHELGHVLGLDHTCWKFSDEVPVPPLDNQGRPSPDCDSPAGSAPEITEATMYTFQNPRETSKRTVESDDIDGVCSAYPIADDPRDYEEVDLMKGGCCAVAGGRDRRHDTTALFMLIVGGAVWGARRRKRSRH